MMGCPQRPELKAHFDIDLFEGTWYEIARSNNQEKLDNQICSIFEVSNQAYKQKGRSARDTPLGKKFDLRKKNECALMYSSRQIS